MDRLAEGSTVIVEKTDGTCYTVALSTFVRFSLCANGKHARWWSKIFGTGKDNCNADGLSCCPVSNPPQSEFMSTTHVAMIHSTDIKTINHLLNATVEQGKDPELTHLLIIGSWKSF